MFRLETKYETLSGITDKKIQDNKWYQHWYCYNDEDEAEKDDDEQQQQDTNIKQNYVAYNPSFVTTGLRYLLWFAGEEIWYYQKVSATMWSISTNSLHTGLWAGILLDPCITRDTGVGWYLRFRICSQLRKRDFCILIYTTGDECGRNTGTTDMDGRDGGQTADTDDWKLKNRINILL